MQISFLTEPVLPLGNGAFLLTQFVDGDQFLHAAMLVAAAAPFRHMQTPGGKFTAAKMSNCGDFGWISDQQGYRYSPVDPLTAQPWPVMPELFLDCAKNAVQACALTVPTGSFVPDFVPNACLVNRYEPKAAMGQHQDRDEADLTQPIVSVSMGDSAVFLLGGADRKVTTQKILLNHGDVLVFSGSARRAYHGVRAPLIGKFGFRVNLTLRRAR
jgi:DNA oxidative demethylase